MYLTRLPHPLGTEQKDYRPYCVLGLYMYNNNKTLMSYSLQVKSSSLPNTVSTTCTRTVLYLYCTTSYCIESILVSVRILVGLAIGKSAELGEEDEEKTIFTISLVTLINMNKWPKNTHEVIRESPFADASSARCHRPLVPVRSFAAILQYSPNLRWDETGYISEASLGQYEDRGVSRRCWSNCIGAFPAPWIVRTPR
jgi:hypothetical protein